VTLPALRVVIRDAASRGMAGGLTWGRYHPCPLSPFPLPRERVFELLEKRKAFLELPLSRC